MKKTIAIVIPMFNESENVDPLCLRLNNVISSLPEYRWRIIFVDDGSSDDTVQRLERHRDTAPMTIIRLSRNFGHQAALKAGLDHADADAVITMDGDLQQPPEMISQFLTHWRDGKKVVQAIRQLDDAAGLRWSLARLGYRIINLFADRPITPESADFRLMDRTVVDALRQMRAPGPMLRGCIAWLGFEGTTVPYPLQPRAGGESRYTLRQFFHLLISGIFDFSVRPLALCGWAGAILLAAVFVFWAFGCISLLLSVVLIVSACELFSLAIVAAYLGRAYRESLGWPLYVVAERLNFDD